VAASPAAERDPARDAERRRAAASLLEEHPLSAGLGRDLVRQMVERAELRTYAPGETILAEGVESQALILLVEGKADVCKVDEASASEHVLNSVARGDVIGEMSFFQGVPASASVRARETLAALVLERSVVSRETLGAAYDRIRGNVALLLMDRQRALSDRQIAILRRSQQQEKERREFGVFFSVIVILVGIDHAVAEISRDPRVDVTSQTFSWGALLFFALPLIFFVAFTRQPLSVFGLSLRGWRRSLLEGLLLSLPLALLAVAGKWAFQQLGWIDAGGPFFTTRSFRDSALLLPGLPGILIGRVQGLLHHFTQELLMRGIVQGSLQRLYARPSPLPAILATSSIFATAHMFISLPFALITFVGGCFFGWVYSRHQTLLGVTLLHFLLHTTVKFLGFL
jgi:CRP-like cAMP-binding protein